MKGNLKTSFILLTIPTILVALFFFFASPNNSKKHARNNTANLEEELDSEEILKNNLSTNGSILSKKRKNDLDKIGIVINASNVNIDEATRDKIQKEKNKFDMRKGVSELQSMLEQSFSDPNSSIKDIKKLQNDITEIKNKEGLASLNTEKWDPLFIYYLMINDNYSYSEINNIRSLSESGLSQEEIEYIREQIKTTAFIKKVDEFKTNSSDKTRSIASISDHNQKEKDDFIDDVNEGPALEERLIEMNYNQDEKEEMTYGQNL